MATSTEYPFWYLALSLKERLQLSGDSVRPVDPERGLRRLARWSAQPPFSTGDLFAQRLAADGLSRDQLALLLGEVVNEDRNSWPPRPAWAVTLEESFLCQREDGARIALPARFRNLPGHELWPFLEPIVRHAWARLAARIQELLRAPGKIPFAFKGLETLLTNTLPSDLLDWSLRTLVLELNVARLQGLLVREQPGERFAEFAHRLEDPEISLGLLKEYPVLARQLVDCTETWSTTLYELLERLCSDWTLITETFQGADPADSLTDLALGAGDRHRGGRSVALLKFHSGFQVVYKPRSLSVDARFQEILETVNTWSPHPGFRTLKVLNQGNYGWVENVATAECRSATEASRFYQRQGGYLALLHMLRATDIHFDNVVAAGEHPVIVDLEAILQPGPPNDDPLAGDFLRESIVQVGLLPVRNWENEASPGLDVSGLGGPDGQLPPRPELYWANQATDQMRLSRQTRQITFRGKHRPSLAGLPLNAVDYTPDIVEGFTHLYQLLLAHREELLAEDGPVFRLAQEEIRVLLRPTAVYGLMLRESFHPDFLRDGLERDRFFDKLWVQVLKRPFLGRVIDTEREALWRGDIPLFTTQATSKALGSGEGKTLEPFFSEPAMDLMRKRLESFGPRDLDRQVWFIKASMAILSTASPEREARPAAPHSPARASNIPREKLERLAIGIGDRLCDWGTQDDDGSVDWLGLQPTRQRAYKIARLGNNLYSGQAGVLLFLAYLGHLTGEARFTSLAQQSCRTLLGRLGEDSEVTTRLGAFEGLGGIIYALCHTAALWDQPDLFTEALRWVDALPRLVEADDQLDVIAGSAGCIAVLAAVHQYCPTPALLRVLLSCGERLMQRALPSPHGTGWITSPEAAEPMTGFSHGTAGIAASLLKLSALSGQPRFREAALEALRYERHLFSREHGNWADVRTQTGRFDQINWCHGAPGIGLARTLILQHEDTQEIRDELDTAVRTTLARGFGRNQSLCHGDLGNMELLLLAQETLPALGLESEIARVTREIVGDIEGLGSRCGLPMDVETPGLMVGLSGIGYGLLRLAAPETIPSVLTLAPPATAPVLPG